MRKVICIFLTIFLVDSAVAAVDGTYVMTPDINEAPFAVISEPIILNDNQVFTISNADWEDFNTTEAMLI